MPFSERSLDLKFYQVSVLVTFSVVGLGDRGGNNLTKRQLVTSNWLVLKYKSLFDISIQTGV